MTSGDVQKSPRFVYLQVAPLALVLFFFFAIPVALVILVSFFHYQMLVGMVPQFTSKNYVDLLSSPTTWALYLSTVKFTVIVLVITFVLGFWIAYFLVFHVRNLLTAIGLFLVCTVPFWTSNIIRMISWRPVLGKEGLINSGLIKAGMTDPGKPASVLLSALRKIRNLISISNHSINLTFNALQYLQYLFAKRLPAVSAQK